MATVLIAGGSGLIGTQLSQILTDKGHEVRHFSRRPNPQSPYPTFVWDVRKGSYDTDAFTGVTHVIHLAGAGIADARWTPKRKEIIINSRTDSTRLLKEGILAHGKDVKAYLAGSAIGFYGDRAEEVLAETSGPSHGFLSKSVSVWEQSIEELTEATQLPTLTVRTGIVLSTRGGALPKMLLPLNFLVSTYFGHGQQWYSWIHLDDICWIFLRGIEDDSFRGMYNGVAPNPERSKTLAATLIKATGKFALLLPAPAFMLRLILGEMSHTVLDSARVSTEKLEASGFTFEYPELESAVKDLIHRKV